MSARSPAAAGTSAPRPAAPPPLAEAAAGQATCPLFGRCGGCTLLHLEAAAYAHAKTQWVSAALAARGLPATVEPLRRAPLASRRRATFTATREGSGIVVGYHAARSHRVVDVPACPALAPPLAAAFGSLRALAAEAAALCGAVRLTATACANGIDVALRTAAAGADRKRGRQTGGRNRRRTGRGPTRPPALTSDDRAIVRVSIDDEPLLVRETAHVDIDGVAVAFPPGAFLQASVEGERQLTDLVAGATTGAGHVVDAFCGLGTFAVPLARQAAVTAVDIDGPALAALEQAMARAPGRRPLSVLRRDLMRHPLAPREMATADAVVFDPPRAGAQALAEAIAASGVARVVAVSCEPVSLARDLSILTAAGYEVTRVTPVDQFVGASHVEVVAILDRSAP